MTGPSAPNRRVRDRDFRRPWLPVCGVAILSLPVIWLLVFDRRPDLNLAESPDINESALLASTLVAACATILALLQGTALAAFCHSYAAARPTDVCHTLADTVRCTFERMGAVRLVLLWSRWE